MATRTPHTGAALEVFTAANLAKYPKGIIGYASTSTVTGSIGGSVTDITGVTVTPTTGASRLLVVTVYIPRIASDTANDAVEVYIKQDGTIIESCFADLSARTAGGSGGNPIHFATAPFTVAAGSYTWKASAVRSTGGSGVLATVTDSDSLAWISVEDKGPSF